MIDDKERRQALADFLRTRRERLMPQEVGLPATARRRTQGLRREEVAQLASISTSWYTALEQARGIHPSEEILENLAEALRFTPAERRHLFLLAQQHPVNKRLESEETASPALQKLIHSLAQHPAYIMGRRWDLIDWNQSAELVFKFGTIQPPHRRNLIWRFFTTPYLREQNNDWERAARAGVARFRADSARYPGDPLFAQLVHDLQHISDEFGLWWSQHDVHPVEDGRKEMNHPELGHLQFDHMTLHMPNTPDIRIVIYTPTPATANRL